jgi:hypothetical protein
MGKGPDYYYLPCEEPSEDDSGGMTLLVKKRSMQIAQEGLYEIGLRIAAAFPPGLIQAGAFWDYLQSEYHALEDVFQFLYRGLRNDYANLSLLGKYQGREPVKFLKLRDQTTSVVRLVSQWDAVECQLIRSSDVLGEFTTNCPHVELEEFLEELPNAPCIRMEKEKGKLKDRMDQVSALGGRREKLIKAFGVKERVLSKLNWPEPWDEWMDPDIVRVGDAIILRLMLWKRRLRRGMGLAEHQIHQVEEEVLKEMGKTATKVLCTISSDYLRPEGRAEVYRVWPKRGNGEFSWRLVPWGAPKYVFLKGMNWQLLREIRGNCEHLLTQFEAIQLEFEERAGSGELSLVPDPDEEAGKLGLPQREGDLSFSESEGGELGFPPKIVDAIQNSPDTIERLVVEVGSEGIPSAFCAGRGLGGANELYVSVHGPRSDVSVLEEEKRYGDQEQFVSLEADCRAFPFPNESVHELIFNNVFGSYDRDPKMMASFLTEASRVLVKGGEIHITEMNTPFFIPDEWFLGGSPDRDRDTLVEANGTYFESFGLG